MSESRDWEVSRVVFEWGSGAAVQIKGDAATDNSTGPMVGAESMAIIGTGKTVEKVERI